MSIIGLERRERELEWELQDVRRKISEYKYPEPVRFNVPIKIELGELMPTKLSKEDYVKSVHIKNQN